MVTFYLCSLFVRFKAIMSISLERLKSCYLQDNGPEMVPKILQIHGFKGEDILRDAKILMEWQETQPHFPDKICPEMLISFMVMSKGSVAVAKQKMDSFFTVRSKFKDIFQNSHPNNPRMIEHRKEIDTIILPKLNHDFTRVLMVRMSESDDIDMVADFCEIMNIAELRLMEDISAGDYIVYDFKNSKFQHVAMVSPMMLKRFLTIIEATLRVQIKGVHLVNAAPFIINFFNVVKPLLKEKIVGRVIFHQSFEDLHKFVDKEILPKEFGGTYKTIAELKQLQTEWYDSHKDYFDRREKWEVKEELRPEKIVNDDFYGYQGNFKKLDVD